MQDGMDQIAVPILDALRDRVGSVELIVPEQEQSPHEVARVRQNPRVTQNEFQLLRQLRFGKHPGPRRRPELRRPGSNHEVLQSDGQFVSHAANLPSAVRKPKRQRVALSFRRFNLSFVRGPVSLLGAMNACSIFRRAFAALTLVTAAAAFIATHAFAEDLQPIFNGKDLDGWVQRGGKANYAVQDGVIVGTTVAGTPNSFLCTKRTYGDFILELEIKADEGLNSGVQIRSQCFDEPTPFFWHGTNQTIPAGRVHGYQVEVDHRPERRWSGGIYEEGRRDWLYPLATNSAASKAYKFGEWNRYRIVCVGDSLKTWINGVPAADLLDAMTLEGFIGLQVHGHPKAGLQVRFRNLRLQDLGRHVWRKAWNGEDFSEAHIIGKGGWKMEDGVIHATHSKAEKEFGHLVSNSRLDDFTVRLKYKAVKGNSGLYFRIEETGATGVSGFQAEIDAEKDAGGLYETNGRAWVSQPSPADVKGWFKPQDWNTMTVHAHGRRIATDVNDHRAAELRDDPGRTEGHFALQLHGGQDVEVYFKDIEILAKDE